MAPVSKQDGLTLAEVLIALVLVGIVAAFAVPKLMVVVANQRSQAVTKELIAMVTEAYERYKLDKGGKVPVTTRMNDLLPYFNYVTYDTTSVVDHVNNSGSTLCSHNGIHCLRFANGAVLTHVAPLADYFCGDGDLNALTFSIDPDGQYNGSTTGSGKAVSIWLYYSGRLRTASTIDEGTQTCRHNGDLRIWNPTPGADPEWFRW